MSIKRVQLPADITVHPTSREERQEQLREIDRQRRRKDPTFKGAFHEKKFKPQKKDKKSKPRKK